MTETKMISARIPIDLVERLAEAAGKSTKSEVIESAIRAYIDPKCERRAFDFEAARQRDELIDQLGLIAAELRRHGGLMALAVKRDEGVDHAELDRTRQKILEIADAVATAIERILGLAG